MSAQGESGGSDSNRNGFSTEWPAGDDAQTFAYKEAELRETPPKRDTRAVRWRINGGDVRGLVDRELTQAQRRLIGNSLHIWSGKAFEIVLQMRITLKTILREPDAGQGVMPNGSQGPRA